MARSNPSTRVPVYQVDFTAQGSGKHVGMSKKKVSFKFGFANEDALVNGEVGVNCRGQEHEVVCVWSIASGKRQVFVDGQPVHHSVTENLKKRFILSFNFLNHHVMKLTVHAAPPLSATKNGIPQRQYDLTLDGQSFFEFARLFELGRQNTIRTQGSSAMVARSHNTSSGGHTPYTNYTLDEPYNREISQMGSPRGVASFSESNGEDSAPAFARSAEEQEEADLRAAIAASLRDVEDRKTIVSPTQAIENETPHNEADLLDLASGELETPQVPQLVAPVVPLGTTGFQEYNAVRGSFSSEPSNGYNQNFESQMANMSIGYSQGDEYAPNASSYDNFRYQQSSHDIMAQYGVSTVPTGQEAPPSFTGISVEDCTEIVPVAKEPSVNKESKPQVKLTMESNNQYLNGVDENADEITKATSLLCNLDSLTQRSIASAERKKKGEEQHNVSVVTTVDKDGKKIVKSKGLPPKSAMATGNLTMQEMQAMKQAQKNQQMQGNQPVMRTYENGYTNGSSSGSMMYSQPVPPSQLGAQQMQYNQQQPVSSHGYSNYAF